VPEEQKVSCEYAEVSRATTKPDVINKLSAIALDEEEAILLVKSQLPDCDVSFRPDARALAFVEFGQKKILFASNLLTEEDVQAGKFYPRLQLAVVAHEIAHHVTGLSHSHDRFFTENLDRISSMFLRSFEDIIELERSKNHRNKQFEKNLNSTLSKIDAERSDAAPGDGPAKTDNERSESKKIDTKKSIGTILQLSCPKCGKPWKEVDFFETDEERFVVLECGHSVLRSNLESNKIFDFKKFKSVKGEHLYKFQEENVSFFAKTGGRMICNDEMGLGKTPTGIAIAEFYELWPVIFVVKSALIEQQARAIQYWTDKEFVQIIRTSKDVPIAGMEAYIISYNLLSRMPNDFFKRVKAKFLICDEVQMIKNPQTQMAKAVTHLSAYCPNVLCLSGTTIKNNAKEYYTVLHITQPGMFPTEAGYVQKHVRTYISPGGFIKYGGLKNPEHFKELTRNFIIRHTQKEVLPDLPPVRRIPQLYDADTYQDEYDSVLDDFMNEFSKKRENFSIFSSIIEKMTKLRHLTGLMKVPHVFEEVVEFLESTDRKIIIFLHHHDVRDELEKLLVKYVTELDNGIKKPLMFNAGMNPETRMKYQDLFNNSPEHRIAIASTLSAGEGLNLQNDCNDLIIMERQWNPSGEVQAIFRLKRIGQKADVINANFPTIVGTIDEYFAEIVANKQTYLDSTLDFNEDTSAMEDSIMKELAEALFSRGKMKWRF